jgi:hypothetical protein
MTIPPFTAFGLLPVGVHGATLEEVKQRFVYNQQRIELFQHLGRLLTVVQRFRFFKGIVLDGSFVTDKPVPEDIDAVLHLSWDDYLRLHRRHDGRSLTAEDAVKAEYKVHLFFDPIPSESWTSAFQSLRPEEGLLRRVPPGTRRGVLKVAL